MNWKLLLILVLISFSGCITTNAEINSQKYLYAGEKAVVPDSRDSVQKEYYLDGKLKSEIYSSYGQITHIRYFDEEDSYLFRQTDYLNGIPVATTTFDEKGSVESKTQY